MPVPIRTGPIYYPTRLPALFLEPHEEVRGSDAATRLLASLVRGREGINPCNPGVVFNAGHGLVSWARAGKINRAGVFADPLLQAAALACQQNPNRKDGFSLSSHWHGVGIASDRADMRFLRRAALYWAGGGRHIDVETNNYHDALIGERILAELGLNGVDIDKVFKQGPAKSELLYHLDRSVASETRKEDVSGAWHFEGPGDYHGGDYRVTLPAWLTSYAAEHGLTQFGTISSGDAMRHAIDMATKNERENTGGPFGSVVTFMEGGEERLLTLAVNRVVPTPGSLWHGEMTAIHYLLALLNDNTDLARTLLDSAVTLYTSACPCIQCAAATMTVLKAVAGSVKIVYAATQAQVESLTGFDEGSIRESDIMIMLAHQGISTQHVEDASAEVALREYGEMIRGGKRKAYNSTGEVVVKGGTAAPSPSK